MSEHTATSTFRRQPHYSFMRPMDFGFFVCLLIFNAWLISGLGSTSSDHFKAWAITAGVSMGTTVGYAWLRYRRRNLCADSGELLLSILIPQTFHMIYEQMNHPNGELLISACLFAVLLPFIARQVWRAPSVAKKLEEDLAALRHAQADPRFTHIDLQSEKDEILANSLLARIQKKGGR